MRDHSRSYTELSYEETFLDRFRYLRIKGNVGEETFGFERYINQKFYTSNEWRNVRQHVIARDLACDLGIEGHDIFSHVIIHHMNPMSVEEIKHFDPDILDPEYLISTTLRTHNAIHYGDEQSLSRVFESRRPGDTTLW